MYFITCFQRYEPNDRIGVPDIGHARTFGYYKDRGAAIESVKRNNCDIQERVYRYAVIECIPEGLYNPATEKIFLEWNEDNKQFELIEPFVDHCGNYAFG